MIRNYFIIALRKIVRNKGYFFINVVGLATGVAACLIIFLVTQFETSFDDFHKNKERIYRVSEKSITPDGIKYGNGSSFPVITGLRIDYPQLENSVAIFSANKVQVTANDNEQKKFIENNIFFTEPQFFEMFNFPWIIGDPKKGLSEPNTTALTQQMAQKYFGDYKSAIGKTITLNKSKTYKIIGIIKDVPENTDFPLGIVLSYKSLKAAASTDWVSQTSNLNVFVQLPKNVSSLQFNSFLDGFSKRHKPAEYIKEGFILQPLNTIHSDSRFGNFRDYTFSEELVTALKLIGLFLLLVACVNFINLATAQAVSRAKEVGIRKVLGSTKKELIFQFLIETLLICFFATGLGVGLAKFSIPWVNHILQASVLLHLNSSILSFLILLILGITVLAGFYPAIILSGYNPVVALKSKLTNKATGGLILRKGLVVFQFVVAQTLIIGTLIIVSQMNFFKNAPLGFDKNAILTVPIPTDSLSRSKMDALKNDLLQESGIKSISYSGYVPADENHWETDFKFDNSIKSTDFSADLKMADADYLKTYGFGLVAGRFYHSSDTINEFVVNETLVHKLGIQNVQSILGKRISFGDPEHNAPVVGVIKDFHSYALDKPITAVILTPWKKNYNLMNLKMDGKKVGEVLPLVEKQWKKAFPSSVYQYQFLDDKMNAYYKQEATLSELYKAFSFVAVLISCLGIYGLISFMTTTRVKEISIRKIVGASVGNIIYLFAKEFLLLMTIGFFIAAPIAWYYMNEWLQKFTYRVHPGMRVFLLAALISVLIAFLTISYKILKLAFTNPAKNLRTE